MRWVVFQRSVQILKLRLREKNKLMPTPSVPTVTLCIGIDLLFYPLPNFSFGRLHKAQSWKCQFWNWDWVTGNYSIILESISHLWPIFLFWSQSYRDWAENKSLERNQRLSHCSAVKSRRRKRSWNSFKLTQKIFHLAIW